MIRTPTFPASSAVALSGFGLGLLTVRDPRIAVIAVVVFSAVVMLFYGQGVFEAKLLGAAIVIGATADIPRRLSLGSITGLGLLTVLLLLLLAPYALYHPNIRQFAPRLLQLFLVWGIAVSCVFLPSKIGVQNLLIYTLFVLILAVTANLSLRDSTFTARIDRAFTAAGWLAVGLYATNVVIYGLGSGGLIGPRSYALFALPILGWAVASFRFEGKHLLLVIALLSMTLLSLSRGAFAAECLMIALAWFNPSRITSWVKTGLVVSVVLIVFFFAIKDFGPFHRRFDTGSITNVGGVQVNDNGRSVLWKVIWRDYRKSPWIGRGAGSADDLAASTFGAGAGNPHNDYLRLIHDYGPIGLVLWVVGYLGLLRRSYRGVSRGGNRSRWHLAAFLAMLGVAVEMFVDNPMIGLDVMTSLAVLVGISCASDGHTSVSHGPTTDEASQKTPSSARRDLRVVRTSPGLEKER